MIHGIQRYKHNAEVECDEGYNIKNKPWYKECVAGRSNMPPEDEWGKARHFEFQKRMEHEAYDCGDVTHVMADKERYMLPGVSYDGERFDSNELLHFLRHAPNLSYTHDPTEARRAINQNESIQDNVALIANKRENTKPGDAQR